jgi:hypothetical protein
MLQDRTTNCTQLQALLPPTVMPASFLDQGNDAHDIDLARSTVSRLLLSTCLICANEAHP